MATGSIKTTNGLLDLLNAHYLGTSNAPTQMGVGIGTTTATTGDTELEIPIPISGHEVVDECDVANWTESADGTAETTNTTTFKRQPDGTNLTSLNLGKNGTASATVSYNKTTTSRDGTNKYLGMWFYIIDSTALAKLLSSGTAVQLRFGSDASNYYYQDFTVSQLSTGWNYLIMNIESPTGTTGTPTKTALDYSYISFTTNNTSDTLSVGDLIMDTWHVFELTDCYKAIETNYPSVNATSLTGEVRMKLGTTNANSFDITESTTKGSTGNIDSHHVFTGKSKSPTDIFTFIEKTKIRNSGGSL